MFSPKELTAMSKTKVPAKVTKQHRVFKQLQVSALSSMMLLAAGHAVAADDAKKDDKSATNKLSTVKVNADAIAADFKADKVSSPKQTQPLIDTPQTIVVVKKELFQQQAATSLSETLRNTPGITMLMGENGNTATGDSIFMRGFDTQGSIFVDGIRDLGSISRDTFNTEQVEIAKGPAGVDNGRGAASGYVNMSSKMASLENAGSGNVSAGSGDYLRATLDVNRALSDTSAVRVNLLKQDAGVAGRDKVENDYQGVAASLGLGLGTDTRAYFNLLSVQQSGIPDGGIPTIGLEGYYNAIFDTGVLKGQTPEAVDRENFYGSTKDFNEVRANMATIRVEHDLAEGVTLRNTSRYGSSKVDQVLTGLGGVTFESAPTITAANPDSWTASRSRQGKDVYTRILTNQTNLTATFDAGGVKHELSGGVEFIYESQQTYTVGVPTGTPAQVGANVYNPSTNDVFNPVVRTGNKTDGETLTSALYVLDTITLNDQFELSAGVRAEKYRTQYDTLTRQTAVTAPAVQTIPVGTMVGSSLEAYDDLISWKLGGVYKPTANGSIYVSYATSQLPPGSSNFSLSATATNANNPNVDPQKGTNQEIGTKWNVYDDKLSLTAAVFRSTNDNEFASNPDGTTTAVGERRVQGVELGASGIVMQNWQVNAGLAYMEPEITRGNRATAAASTDGGVIQWSPKLTFTLWNSYTFNNGFVLGGGARYIDSVASTSLTNAAALATRSMVEVPDYWVVDAMASYPLSKNINLQLNVFNLLDEEYIASINNGVSRYYPGVERSARLGVNFSF
jgi:catecholate siderophore receptor